jgi:hypothetical protein
VGRTIPFEDWRYRFVKGIGKNIHIEFVENVRTGEYHIAMDPSEKDAVAGTTPAVYDQFERLRLFARLQTAPQLKLKRASRA